MKCVLRSSCETVPSVPSVTGLLCGRRTCGQPGLAGPRNMVGRLLVFVADEFDHLLVDHESLVHADGERFRVSLRVVNRDIDFERAEVRSAEPFGHLQSVAVRAAVDVEPSGALITIEVGGLDDQRVVAFVPVSYTHLTLP